MHSYHQPFLVHCKKKAFLNILYFSMSDVSVLQPAPVNAPSHPSAFAPPSALTFTISRLPLGYSVNVLSVPSKMQPSLITYGQLK